MPRFYFHARGPGRSVPDAIGEELPDIETARAVALQVMADATSGPYVGATYDAWAIEVADESGRVVLTVPFRARLNA